MLVALVGGLQAADGEPDPGLELRGTAGVEDDVVHPPVVGDDREAALGDDEEDGHVAPGRADQPREVAALREFTATVDEHHVGVRRIDQRAARGRQHLDLVRQQRERREHLRGRLEGVGEQQQRPHRPSCPFRSFSDESG